MSYSFERELATYGPDADYLPPPIAEARKYCQSFTKSSYENFSVISFLLEKPLVPHFEAVYSFCRWADDLGDQTGGGQKSLDLLRWWRSEVELCYQGKPHHPVFVSLAETIRKFRMPKELFTDLIFAFEQDQMILEYQSQDQLLDYCRYSANPVGRLVLMMWECHDEKALPHSDQICTALQLTNFWQDVARDYDMGRIYLPKQEMERHGYSTEDFQKRLESKAFGDLMKEMVDRTSALFDEGSKLLEMVPAKRRVDLALFVEGGRAILEKIRKQDYKVWSQRPRLSKWEKLCIFLKNWWSGGKVRESGELSQSRDYCRNLSRATAGNFYRTFQLLDSSGSDAMCAIYAFMRISDDLVDDAPDSGTATTALTQWRKKTLDAMEGTFSHPIHPAFVDTIQKHRIPIQYFLDVLDGTGMDLQVREYQTFAELYQYCYRVASAVGLACIHVWGFHDENAKKPAEAAGIALQLTNILRDIPEDFERGRVYLPREDMERFGYTQEMLQRREYNPQFLNLMRFEVQRAKDYYLQARGLAKYLKGRSRGIFLAILETYEAILNKIEENGFQVLGEKIRVHPLHKAWILLRCFLFGQW
jgi:squalene synthase HpnC